MATEMRLRFEARWVNGFWVTFDRHSWKHFAIHNYETEAEYDAVRRNVHG